MSTLDKILNFLAAYGSMVLYVAIAYGAFTVIISVTVPRLPRLVETPGIGKIFILQFLSFSMVATTTVALLRDYLDFDIPKSLVAIVIITSVFRAYHLRKQYKARLPLN